MSAPSVKLISLNIEKERHLDRVEDFLRSQPADLVCLQELVESSIPRLAGAFGAGIARYVPMKRRLSEESPPRVQGIGVFSRVPIDVGVRYYNSYADAVPDSAKGDPTTYNVSNRPLVVCDVKKAGQDFRIVTTHFTWTPDGQASELQWTDMRAMMSVLEELGEFVLCGDLNAPRGGKIFSMLAEKYTDNIPPEYISSLDPDLHRAGHLRLMVDGLFTTPAYRASEVRLQFGVSDHAAIIAEISKT